MYKYTCLNPIAQIGLDNFTTDYRQVDDVNDADAILVRSAQMHDMEVPDKLLAVARAGAGTNNIPVDELGHKGVVVFNTPGANANAVKELVLSGMFLASRDIIGGIKWCEENASDENIAKAAEKAKKQFAGTELAGKKLGVIGLGAIGVKVANAATHLGMEVYGYDPYISVKAAWNLSRSVKHISNVEDIYKQCDFITVHVPLLDATRKMINRDSIHMMKRGVVILNFARDLLVDEEALLGGLHSGKVRHYVTDFANPTVAGQKGVILTPHLGASTAEAEDNCAVMAVDEIRDYIENGNIKNAVNYPNCDLGVCQTAGRIAVIHINKKGVISSYTTALGDADINVADMSNKSRGEYAYALLDIDSPITDEAIAKIEANPNVIKVRVIK